MTSLNNSVRLTGFLGGNPEVKTFSNNRTSARVSLAVHARYRNSQGEWAVDTQWHSLVFWGKQALFAHEKLCKGSKVTIEGKLVNRQYVDKEGITRYITEIKVNEILPVQRQPN